MKRVLFVCMGNICRSPAAEGVLRHLVKQKGLENEIEIQSAGTIGYHEGELPDRRMREAALKRGYDLCSRAKMVTPADLERFDVVLAMDRDNLFHLHALDRNGQHRDKIKLLTDYHPTRSASEVPDPYFGGPEGFELVLDLVEKCCSNLLDELARK